MALPPATLALMAVQGDTSFGTWLKARRKALDLTQFDLAERIGCAESTIQRIEAGERRPSKQVATLMAEVLGIPTPDQPEFVRFARGQAPAPAPPPREATHPDPSSLSSPSSRALLPVPLTSLVGREVEFEAARALLSGSHGRLLTLTGPPGVGKTRLALALAGALATEFPGGACFVPLAPLRDPALLADYVARTLGLQDGASGPPGPRLGAYLRNQRLLLVLDNFEQVVDAAPQVGEWLGAAPGVRVLVTSRTALGLRGERRFPVPTLAVPPLDVADQPEALIAYPAVELFVERAQAVDPTFQLTPANAAAVAALCTWLEGVPLAIELAAVRAARLSPHEIRAGLSRRLDLSAHGLRDLPIQQQTLRAAIDWSYALFGEAERLLFVRMAVFVGGATLDALEAVCNAHCDLRGGLHPPLEALLEQSLITRTRAGDAKERFGMLETIREYAEELLDASDEQAELRRLHAEYYSALAEAAQPHLRGADQKTWLDRLELDHNNLRAAYDWLLRSGAVESCLHLAGALGEFWDLRGHWSEGLTRIETVLAHLTPGIETPARAMALQVVGTLHGDLGAIDPATRALEQSVTLWRTLGDEKNLASALVDCGYWLSWSRPYDGNAVLTRLNEGLQLYRKLEDNSGVAFALLVLADQAQMRSDVAQARALLEESNELFEQARDRWGIAWSLNRLTGLSAQQGDLSAARLMGERSLGIFRELQVKEGEGASLGYLASLACDEGDLATATALCERLAALQRELGNSQLLTNSLINLGHLRRLQGNAKAALTSYLEAQSLVDSSDGPESSYYRHFVKGLLAQAYGSHAKALVALGECLKVVDDYPNDSVRAKRRAACLVAMTTSLLAEARVEEAATILEALSSVQRVVTMDRPNYTLDYARNLATTRALLGAQSLSRARRP